MFSRARELNSSRDSPPAGRLLAGQRPPAQTSDVSARGWRARLAAKESEPASFPLAPSSSDAAGQQVPARQLGGRAARPPLRLPLELPAGRPASHADRRERPVSLPTWPVGPNRVQLAPQRPFEVLLSQKQVVVSAAPATLAVGRPAELRPLSTPAPSGPLCAGFLACPPRPPCRRRRWSRPMGKRKEEVESPLASVCAHGARFRLKAAQPESSASGRRGGEPALRVARLMGAEIVSAVLSSSLRKARRCTGWAPTWCAANL